VTIHGLVDAQARASDAYAEAVARREQERATVPCSRCGTSVDVALAIRDRGFAVCPPRSRAACTKRKAATDAYFASIGEARVDTVTVYYGGPNGEDIEVNVDDLGQGPAPVRARVAMDHDRLDALKLALRAVLDTQHRFPDRALAIPHLEALITEAQR
jgi:hypothetical protein